VVLAAGLQGEAALGRMLAQLRSPSRGALLLTLVILFAPQATRSSGSR